MIPGPHFSSDEIGWTEPRDGAEADAVADAINRRWQDPAFILEVARLCHHVNSMPNGPTKDRIKSQVAFGAAKFSKYATIGSATHLLKDCVKPHLPPHFTILYLIARLEPEALESAVEAGIITPFCRAADIQPLILGFQAKPKRKPADIEIDLTSNDGGALLSLIAAIRAAKNDGIIKLKVRSDRWNEILSAAPVGVTSIAGPEPSQSSKTDIGYANDSTADLMKESKPFALQEIGDIDANA